MRLWHQSLIEYLPDKQLLGQHREICALRGLGFGKRHRVVNYVFDYPYYWLYKFHLIVMKEMESRHFNVNKVWYNPNYRGKKIGFDNSSFTKSFSVQKIIYQEHNISYLKECLINLNSKNIYLAIPANSFLIKIIKKNYLSKYITIIE